MTAQRSEPYLPVARHERSDASNGNDNDQNDTENMDQTFRPFWTRRRVLICFILCFLVTIAALEVILQQSDKHQGLATADTGQHYLWAYGPTAIFTIVLALWNRVDYRLRQMTPWLCLKRSDDSAADKNLYKDYVTLSMPEILWHSIRNRDSTVTAGTLIVGLTTLLMVISTGLLVLEPKQIYQSGVPYQLVSSFNSTDMTDLIDSTLINDIIDAIDTRGLHYPFGATPEFAYSTFAPKAALNVSDPVQSAMVDVITSELTCTPAELNMSTVTDDSPAPACMSQSTALSFATNNCSSPKSAAYPMSSGPEVYYIPGEARYFAYFYQTGCDEDIGKNNAVPHIFLAIGQYEPANLTELTSINDGCGVSPSATMRVLQSRQFICTVVASQAVANVTFNTTDLNSGDLPTFQVDSKLSLRHPLSDAALTSTVYGDGGIGLNHIFGELSNENLATQVLNATLAGQRVSTDSNPILPRILRPAKDMSPDELLDSDLLADLTRDYTRQAIALAAHYGLRIDRDEIVNGVLSVTEERLLVQLLPVRLMQGLSGLVVLLLAYITYAYSRSFVLADPGLLAGTLALVSQYQNLEEAFRGKGALRDSALPDIVSDKQLINQDDTKGCLHEEEEVEASIETQVTGDTRNREPSWTDPRVEWWVPIIMKKPARASMIVLICLTIIALEILLSVSNRSEGIATVSYAGYVHLAWSAIPAGLMVLIAMFCRALGSQHKLFAPFVRLRAHAPIGSLFRNYSSMTEPEALVLSIKGRQWTITVMSLSAILSAFLTIIISGVWTTSMVPTGEQITLNYATRFQDRTNDNGTAGNNAWLSGLILAANLSWPQWTYSDLTFPSFDLASVRSSGNIRTQLPALRTALNCTLYTEQDFDAEYCLLPVTALGTFYMCLGTPGGGECANGNYTDYYLPSYPGPGPEPVVVAQPDESGGSWSSFQENLEAGCRSINYYWGWQDVKSTGNDRTRNFSATHARALSCSDQVEEVQMDVSLLLPDFAVDATNPPKAVSSPNVFSTEDIPLPYGELISLNNNSLTIKGIWAILASGSDITTDDFKDPASDDKIVNAIKSAHGIIRAQQYNAALRVNTSSTDPSSSPQNVTATYTSPGRLRLIQNATSTHVLSAVLFSMLLCIILASCLTSINYVLPKNPGSIAAQISLVADSNILKDPELMDEIRRALRDRKLLRRFERRIFGMGWFDSVEGGGGAGEGDGDMNRKVWTINAVDGKAADEISQMTS